MLIKQKVYSNCSECLADQKKYNKKNIKIIKKELLNVLQVCDSMECYHIGIVRILEDILPTIK